MTMFCAGTEFTVDGYRFRVVEGEKPPKARPLFPQPDEQTVDLRLDIRIDGSWRPVPMSIVGMTFAFWCQNEDYLYPPGFGYKGRRKVKEFLRECEKDWRAAVRELERERALAAARRENGHDG